jgi:hypothetical protein
VTDGHNINAQKEHPQEVNQVSAAWLTEALRHAGAIVDASVVRVEPLEFHCWPSYFSKIARLKLEYDNQEPGAPGTVIVKGRPEIAQQREFGRQFRAFLREIHFYREIAPNEHEINLPGCYYSWLDDATGDGIIILEDLSHLQCGDQLGELPYEHVSATVKMIGTLHARWWDAPKLAQLSWVPLDNYTLAEHFHEHWPAFVRLYESRLSPKSMHIGAVVSERMHDILNTAKTRPHTLVHCDLRADNLRIDPANPSHTAILDWQLVTRGLATFDLVRLICESTDFEVDTQKNLVGIWRDTLLDRGVSGYSQEQAWQDYELALAIALYIPVINASLLTGASERTARLIDIMAHRFFRCAEMLRLGEFLQQL